MTLLSLRTGPLAVDLAPSAGGAIARFAIGDRDVLRPMADADRHSGRGNNGSAYPLVPFSNRIKDGRLVFGGKTFHLKNNWPGVHHPMHGDGWSHAWQVVRADAHGAEIVYEHARDGENGGWPFRYRARQSHRLDADRLSMTMTLENLEDHAVPAGIGLHPFFMRDADTELQTRTDFMWTSDAETLPVERIATPPEADFTRARNVNETKLDNGFDGWARHATIRWPLAALQLDLEASPAFGHAVIYVPPGRAYFCVEPVSHANGQVGNTYLDAGATLSGEIVFRISEKQK
jgi:aldose 1-epimerase